jgi:hypothetical protein
VQSAHSIPINQIVTWITACDEHHRLASREKVLSAHEVMPRTQRTSRFIWLSTPITFVGVSDPLANVSFRVLDSINSRCRIEGIEGGIFHA